MQKESKARGMTAYHAAYFAHELTKRNASDNIAKLGPSLFNARVDLNPHQLDAALFAFRSPLSRGAILADMGLKDLDAQIKEARTESKLAAKLEDKLAWQKQIKDLETKRNRKRRDLYEAQDEIEARKGGLISEVEARLQQSTQHTDILGIKWTLI